MVSAGWAEDDPGLAERRAPGIRIPVDVEGGPAPKDSHFQAALDVIRRSGLVEVLSPLMDADVGRPRSLTLEALFVAMLLNAQPAHHVEHLVQITIKLNSL